MQVPTRNKISSDCDLSLTQPGFQIFIPPHTLSPLFISLDFLVYQCNYPLENTLIFHSCYFFPLTLIYRKSKPGQPNCQPTPRIQKASVRGWRRKQLSMITGVT